jgi:hypothetical protein
LPDVFQIRAEDFMTPQEREMIAGLFTKLQPFESQPRDSDADKLIRDLVARQPAAPYLMAQTVLVQEQALKAAQERIAELEGKSGFMGSAPVGPWGAKTGARPSAVPQSAGQPAPQSAPQGGSFLRTALGTAAGIAGGMMLFEGLRHMFSGNQAGPWGGQQANNAQPFLGPNDNFSGDTLSGADGAPDDFNLADSGSDFDPSGGFDDSSGFDDI